ncbi:tRNA-guanosine(34) preQ1 transglycosylase [Sarracenia purpurea var. burkii]
MEEREGEGSIADQRRHLRRRSSPSATSEDGEVLEGLSPKIMSNIGGLHQMLGLHKYEFAAVPRDSVVCLPECDGTNKTGASFETPCGHLLVILSNFLIR